MTAIQSYPPGDTSNPDGNDNQNMQASAADILQLFNNQDRLTPQSAFAAIVSGGSGGFSGPSRAGSSLLALPDSRTITTSAPNASDLKQQWPAQLGKAGSSGAMRLLPLPEEPPANTRKMHRQEYNANPNNQPLPRNGTRHQDQDKHFNLNHHAQSGSSDRDGDKNFSDEDGDGDGSSPGGTRKRIGRPLAFNGDPDDPGLSEEERRKIKRRIANRESARRVRHKRQEMMEELQHKCAILSQQNARLLSHATSLEQQRSMLANQVTAMRDKYAVTTNEQNNFKSEVSQMRKLLKDNGINLPETLTSTQHGGAGTNGGGFQQPSASLTAALNALTASTCLPGSAFTSLSQLQPMGMQQGNGQFMFGGLPALPVLTPASMKYM